MIHEVLICTGNGVFDVRINGAWVRTCQSRESALAVINEHMEDWDRADSAQ